MHNPKDGWFKMPNGFFEAWAKLELPIKAERIVKFIIRESWGYRKRKTKYLKLTDFCLALDMQKGNVSRELKRLREANIVIYIDNLKHRSYQIQRDFTKWKRLPMQITLYKRLSTKRTKVIYIDNQKPSKPLAHKGKPSPKRHILKTYQKKNLVAGIGKNKNLQLAQLLLDKIRGNKPDFRPGFTQADLQRWGKDMNVLLGKDGRNPERVAEVIKWCQADNTPDASGFCWAVNILSPRKLRKQFDQLEMRMNNRPKPEVYEEFGLGIGEPVEDFDWNSPELAKPETVSNGVKEVSEKCENGKPEKEAVPPEKDFTGMDDPSQPKLIGKEAVDFEKNRERLRQQAERLKGK